MLDKNIFIEMILAGFIIDGRTDGLILGRSHENGNIYMLKEWNGEYVCSLSMEGGEYLINKTVYLKNKKRIEEINSFKKPHELPPIKISNLLRIVNTNSNPNDKILLIEDGQFIINKHAIPKLPSKT